MAHSPFYRTSNSMRKSFSPTLPASPGKKATNALLTNFWMERERPEITDDSVEVNRLKTVVFSQAERLKVFLLR